jgi:hypothetical protein
MLAETASAIAMHRRVDRIKCLPQMKISAAAEKAQKPDHDQINGDDIIEQPRHDQDQDSG